MVEPATYSTNILRLRWTERRHMFITATHLPLHPFYQCGMDALSFSLWPLHATCILLWFLHILYIMSMAYGLCAQRLHAWWLHACSPIGYAPLVHTPMADAGTETSPRMWGRMLGFPNILPHISPHVGKNPRPGSAWHSDPQAQMRE